MSDLDDSTADDTGGHMHLRDLMGMLQTLDPPAGAALLLEVHDERDPSQPSRTFVDDVRIEISATGRAAVVFSQGDWA